MSLQNFFAKPSTLGNINKKYKDRQVKRKVLVISETPAIIAAGPNSSLSAKLDV